MLPCVVPWVFLPSEIIDVPLQPLFYLLFFRLIFILCYPDRQMCTSLTGNIKLNEHFPVHRFLPLALKTIQKGKGWCGMRTEMTFCGSLWQHFILHQRSSSSVTRIILFRKQMGFTNKNSLFHESVFYRIGPLSTLSGCISPRFWTGAFSSYTWR